MYHTNYGKLLLATLIDIVMNINVNFDRSVWVLDSNTKWADTTGSALLTNKGNINYKQILITQISDCLGQELSETI